MRQLGVGDGDRPSRHNLPGEVGAGRPEPQAVPAGHPPAQCSVCPPREARQPHLKQYPSAVGVRAALGTLAFLCTMTWPQTQPGSVTGSLAPPGTLPWGCNLCEGGPWPSSVVSSAGGWNLCPLRAWALGFSSRCPKPPTSSEPSPRLWTALPSPIGTFTLSLCRGTSCLSAKSSGSRLRIRGHRGCTPFQPHTVSIWPGVMSSITAPVALGGTASCGSLCWQLE